MSVCVLGACKEQSMSVSVLGACTEEQTMSVYKPAGQQLATCIYKDNSWPHVYTKTIVGHMYIQGRQLATCIYKDKSAGKGAQHDRYHCVKWCEPNYPLNACSWETCHFSHHTKCELHAQLHCTGKHATLITLAEIILPPFMEPCSH